MADKKKKSSSKKTNSKEKTQAPDMETNVDEPKANVAPKKDKGDNPRVWNVEPKQAASLRTSRGVLIKGRPRPVIEGSSDYEFYKKRADVNLTAKA